MNNLLDSTFKSLRMGAPTACRNLTCFPLIGLEPSTASYLVLDRALAEGLVRIGEVSEGGQVPQLNVDNLSSQPVLLVDGEELIGARQNRVLNTSLLAAPHAGTVVPVSCVEQGRWGYRARRPAPEGSPVASERLFQTAERVHYAKGRASRMDSVSQSRRSDRWESDQGAVWGKIRGKLEQMSVASPTGAMSDAFEHHAAELDEYVRAFSRSDPEQRGVVVAVGGDVAGIELFDCADTYRCLAPKIVRSYALDAMELRGQTRSARREDAEAFVIDLRSSEGTSRPSVGLGTDVRFETQTCRGAALEHEGTLVHLACFHRRWA